MIVVTGATGNNGRELVKQLSAAGQKVRAFVRDADKADHIQYPGVEIVRGDLAQPDTIEKALKGAERAFLLSSTNEHQVELQSNFIKAAKKVGVKHVVKLSVVGAALDAPAQLMRWHAQTEKELEASGLAWTHIQPHVFYQIWLMLAYPIAISGTFYSALKRSVPLAAIDCRDIAAVAVKTLTEKGHEGKTYKLTGPEALTNVQVAHKISRFAHKEVKYLEVPGDQVRAGMVQMGFPPAFADVVAGMDEAYTTGNYSYVNNEVERITGKKPYTADEFFNEFGKVYGEPPAQTW